MMNPGNIYNCVIAGIGGQGTLSAAALMAQAAFRLGLRFRQSEVHGMAQRGGAVLAHLRIAAGPIPGDLIPPGGADLIIALEPLEGLRYLSMLSPQGRLVTSTDSVVNIPNYPDKVKLDEAVRELPGTLYFSAEALAKEAGNPRTVNMVMLGAASVFLPPVAPLQVAPSQAVQMSAGIWLDIFEQAIDEFFTSRGRAHSDGAVNKRAFMLGRRAAAQCAGLPAA